MTDLDKFEYRRGNCTDDECCVKMLDVALQRRSRMGNRVSHVSVGCFSPSLYNSGNLQYGQLLDVHDFVFTRLRFSVILNPG